MNRHLAHVVLSVALLLTAGAREPTTAPASLPATWHGHWKGDAKLVMENDVRATFVTELIIKPTDKPARHTWTLIYDGAMGRQVRNYTLVAKDAGKGSYEIDEGQGIVLPATLLGDVLASSFEVMGNRIDATYELRTTAHGTSLEMRLVTKRADEPVKTGGKDGVPEVIGWTPISLQTCTLRLLEQ